MWRPMANHSKFILNCSVFISPMYHFSWTRQEITRVALKTLRITRNYRSPCSMRLFSLILAFSRSCVFASSNRAFVRNSGAGSLEEMTPARRLAWLCQKENLSFKISGDQRLAVFHELWLLFGMHLCWRDFDAE